MEEENVKKEVAIEQPEFEVRDFRENRPTYAIDGSLVWKRKSKKQKRYPIVKTEDVKIRKGGFIVREDVLRQSRELYEQTHELIPVGLDAKKVLVNGYEQYLIAKEMGIKFLMFVPVKISRKEQRLRRRRNVQREKREQYQMRKKKKANDNGKDN
ncbi:hypothetical protein [Anaerotignum sp.]